MVGRGAFLTLLLTAAVVSAGAESPPIDVSGGSIEDRTALAFWPAVGLDSHELADPSGFEVHLVPEGYGDEEVHPCGAWFQPSPGKYKYWLEGPGWMSPASYVVVYRGAPGKGRPSVRPVVPAGRVTLAPGWTLPEGATLRLLHTESHNRGEAPRREISRRVAADRASAGVQMPEGEILAVLHDDRAGEYLALSRPIAVSRGETTSIDPQPPPKSASDLLVILERPRRLASFDGYDVELTISGPEGQKREPAVTVPTIDRLHAVWYGVEERRVTLRVGSPTVHLEPAAIVLRGGRVEVFRDSLRPRPAIEVELRLPPDLEPTATSALEVQDVSTGERLARRELSPERHRYRFDRLPPGPLQVVLDLPPWYLVESVDLGDGADGRVVFEPRPIDVHGTVYRGGEGHPATVRFGGGGPPGERYQLAVEAGEDGSYEARLFRPGYYLAWVKLREVPGPPHFEPLPDPIREPERIDFRFPASDFTVRVVDSGSGEGVAGAEVAVSNLYLGRADREMKNSRRVEADEQGVAVIGPLFPGEATFLVRAESYLPAEEGIAVAEDDGEREIIVPLRPEGATGSLELLLPTGGPAVEAEAIALHALDADPFWRGRADGSGKLRVPEAAQGTWLAVRHDAAAFLLRRWQGEDSTEWTLPPAAPPLILRAVHPWGDPAPRARWALRAGEHRLAGPVLQWLTGGTPAGPDGLRRVDHLPPAPVQALAWLPGQGTANPAAAFDALAVTVAYPWEGVVEVEVVE